jgi:acyl-CoA thioesterase I
MTITRRIRAVMLAVLAVQVTARAAADPAETCLSASPAVSLGASLPRLKRAIAGGENVAIVALGSSSTRGVGASSWAASYPEVMQRELKRLRPAARTVIVNSGRNGETVAGQLARIDADVLAHKPALVIWQLGSNDVAMPWGGLTATMESEIVAGVRAMKAAGADVILMDLQNAPAVANARDADAMLRKTARAARTAGAGHFRRFDLLQRAVASGVPLAALTSWDQLHNTDAAYDCTGRALARAIHRALR